MERFPEANSELSEMQLTEMHQLIGRVATIYARLDQQRPYIVTTNPEVKSRGLVGRLHSETLRGEGSTTWLNGRMAHIGFVEPSQADTPEASKARHPASHPPTAEQQHYEIWLFPRQSHVQPTENYRFYPGDMQQPPYITEPEADGRSLRSLDPSRKNEKRWGHLNDVIQALEARLGRVRDQG